MFSQQELYESKWNKNIPWIENISKFGAFKLFSWKERKLNYHNKFLFYTSILLMFTADVLPLFFAIL